jgi:hypothetical protein
MGEIKSTLDLVMEKTRHLSLSDEEKQKQKNVEIEKRINGLLQKCHNQILSTDELQKEYARLKKEFSLANDSCLINQIINSIDPVGDNLLLLALLNKFCDDGGAGVESLLGEFQDEFNSAASYRLVELREDLAKNHHISGSAVVPNLQTDGDWLAEAGALRARFAKELEAEKEKLERN